MTVSALDVAAALRERLRGLNRTKLHKLLYYCQGHHLATFGHPLFRETLSAWDMGPVVGELWFREGRADAEGGSSANLDQAQLNTVGYVVSRYGRLTASDLINLTHAERPWLIANARRRPGESVRIERSWLLEFFRESSVDDDDEVLDSDTVSSWLAGVVAARDGRGAGRPDSREELLARLTRG